MTAPLEYATIFEMLEDKVSPDLSNAVYRAYAKAMFEAQGLEATLTLILFEVGFEESPAEQITDFVRTSRFDFEFSLGTLIQALKRKIRPLPKGLKKDLERALDVRNLLAHKYFLKNQLKFLYGKWVRELVQELEEMRSVLQQVNRRLMAIYDALQRPKARLALKSIEGRAHETISMMAELVILAEECEESKNEEQLQEDL